MPRSRITDAVRSQPEVDTQDDDDDAGEVRSVLCAGPTQPNSQNLQLSNRCRLVAPVIPRRKL
jgi:hypothetical protein